LGKVTSEHEPRLGQLFQDDSEAFDKVIHARILRDNEADTLMRKQYGQHARQLLISATEIPIKICQECLQVADYAVVMFDNGYKAVRGDSGTAAVQAVAAAKSSLGVCFLNLTSFRDGAWAARTRDFCHQLFAEVQERQSRVDRRIYGLGQEAEALLAGQLELRLEMLPSA
jgi:formiminotetrahydrofolate cyclodeaminase